ncbi:MAG: hypothetical protein PHR71_02340 [Polaromonas sp.]|nr:hypothetical protein [Polaromonas sp.]
MTNRIMRLENDGIIVEYADACAKDARASEAKAWMGGRQLVP